MNYFIIPELKCLVLSKITFEVKVFKVIVNIMNLKKNTAIVYANDH